MCGKTFRRFGTSSLLFPCSAFAPQTVPTISHGFSKTCHHAPGPWLQFLRGVCRVEVVKELLEAGGAIFDEDGVEFENIGMVDVFTDECMLYGRFSVVTEVREGVNGKKTFSFGHCPNHLNPPITPIRATWSSFFRESKFKIWKSV